jgi:hypothetical protein
MWHLHKDYLIIFYKSFSERGSLAFINKRAPATITAAGALNLLITL